MSKLVLYAPDASALSMLVQRLGDVAGVAIAEERRKRPRRDPRSARVHAREERTGQERRVPPILGGTFALRERA